MGLRCSSPLTASTSLQTDHKHAHLPTPIQLSQQQQQQQPQAISTIGSRVSHKRSLLDAVDSSEREPKRVAASATASENKHITASFTVDFAPNQNAQPTSTYELYSDNRPSHFSTFPQKSHPYNASYFNTDKLEISSQLNSRKSSLNGTNYLTLTSCAGLSTQHETNTRLRSDPTHITKSYQHIAFTRHHAIKQQKFDPSPSPIASRGVHIQFKHKRFHIQSDDEPKSSVSAMTKSEFDSLFNATSEQHVFKQQLSTYQQNARENRLKRNSHSQRTTDSLSLHECPSQEDSISSGLASVAQPCLYVFQASPTLHFDSTTQTQQRPTRSHSNTEININATRRSGLD